MSPVGGGHQWLIDHGQLASGDILELRVPRVRAVLGTGNTEALYSWPCGLMVYAGGGMLRATAAYLASASPPSQVWGNQRVQQISTAISSTRWSKNQHWE